ncbi:MAG: AAA family ATPase [Limnochordia bacterium]|jgi:cell division protease FtsH
MTVEILIGTALAFLVVAALQGVDVTPFIVLGGIAVVVRLMLDGRSIGRQFEVLGRGKSSTSAPRVTFSDIGGQEVAKRELIEALDLIRNPETARCLGIRPLKGILLAGPPGTGKTLLAKAAASYTDSAFMAVSGSEFVEMYAGVGAQRVRKLFQEARSQAKKLGLQSAIVFIDEIEVLGGRRGHHTSHLEYDQTLNELLVQMDGMSSEDESIRLLVVGATNRPDLLDGALLRPGRFDRTVRVDLPDKEGRLHILRIHSRNRPLASDVDLEQLARETYSFSGAHLEALINEGAILAMRAGREYIEEADLREAVDKVLMGERLDRRPSAEERTRVAYHEAGHALISEMVRPGSVSSVTVTPRGAAMGFMRQSPQDDRYLYTKQDLLDQIAVCLGGAVAEEVVLGSRSTGAINDFEKAVDLAGKLISAGLSELGIIDIQNAPTQMIHEETRRVIRDQEEYVRRQIMACKDRLQEVAQYLFAEEHISGAEFRRMIGPTQPLSRSLSEGVSAALAGAV